jgi:hypothetical protein
MAFARPFGRGHIDRTPAWGGRFRGSPMVRDVHSSSATGVAISAGVTGSRKVSKEADATADARHDLRTDRSSLEHPAVERATAKSHRR